MNFIKRLISKFLPAKVIPDSPKQPAHEENKRSKLMTGVYIRYLKNADKLPSQRQVGITAFKRAGAFMLTEDEVVKVVHLIVLSGLKNPLGKNLKEGLKKLFEGITKK